MPVQRTLFGRPVALRLPPRRFQFLLGVLVIFAVSFLSLPVPDRVGRTVDTVKGQVLDSIPDSLHKSLGSAHRPPDDAAAAGAGWFADWRWRRPFSQAAALDDDRAALPPLGPRPPVYTYYEPQRGASRATAQAQEKLLLVWRRAWWAQGFRPVVLGKAEAMRNPLYARFRGLEKELGRIDTDDDGVPGMVKGAADDMLRWLAWGHMGSGVLMDWLVLPMAARDDKMLMLLREGGTEGVTHFASYGEYLFSGEKVAINQLLTSVLDAPERLSIASSVLAAAHRDRYDVVMGGAGIALYDLATMQQLYTPIAEWLTAPDGQSVQGLTYLAELINAHLHTVWQNTHAAGIAVVKPLRHMTTLVAPAMDIARSLQACPSSPMPASCPPNFVCQPCTEGGLPILNPPAYRNLSDTFTIGSVPHPYTATTLDTWHRDIDVTFVRRESKRDIWLAALTGELLDPAISSSRRIVAFKDAVAGAHGAAHSLWLTAERESDEDLNWFFGFELPAAPEPAPGAALTYQVPADAGAPPPPADELAAEKEMLEWARKTLRSSYLEQKRTRQVREAVEAWSLADTEAWRFAKAYSARRKAERLAWEKAEHKFAGSEKGGR